MADTYQVGYGAYQDKFDMLNADIDRRFGIFNTVTANKFLEQDRIILNINNNVKQLKGDLSNAQFYIKYLEWRLNLPWYKKIFYYITNKELINIFKNGNIQS